MAAKDLTAIGLEILQTARNELYLNLPYLDVALCSLDFQPGGGVTLSLATDGETLYYDGSFLSERYLRSRTAVDRAYLHVLLHCMLRHLWKKRGRAPELWDLACDVAVESILDELDYPCLAGGFVPAKQKFYGECRAEMPVLTAEGIYRHLLRLDLPEYELARLQRTFLVDDHGLWDPDQQDQEQQKQREQKWQGVSEKTQTGLETVLAGKATGGEAVLEQIQVENRERYDYRHFLQRFSVLREEMQVDPDSFDTIFYTYGLSLYGNMPLIEPLESKEVSRIEDFVVVIDTSMSCSGDLVRCFLEETYDVLCQSDSYFKKTNIHIIQCDEQVQQDRLITNQEEMEAYMRDFTIIGQGGTDFRPAFEYVNGLIRQGAFRRLKGLLYFTDGEGIYPVKRPVYDTAFVFLKDQYTDISVPAWAMKVILEPEQLLEMKQEKPIEIE